MLVVYNSDKTSYHDLLFYLLKTHDDSVMSIVMDIRNSHHINIDDRISSGLTPCPFVFITRVRRGINVVIVIILFFSILKCH